MMTAISLQILSPERELVHESVASVELPGTLGRFVVLEGHAPLISSLCRGDITYRIDEGKEGKVSISSGFVEVCGNHVTACVEL